MSELTEIDELDEQYQKQYLNYLFEKSSLPEFKNLKTLDDYFYYSLNNLIEEKVTFERLDNGKLKYKNNNDALKYRNSSFDKYKLPETRDLDDIIEDCTKSIAYAEPNSNEFILCYMNRSSALFKSHLYDDCLNDINYIFNNNNNNNINLNDSQKVKLLVKKSQCYEILKYKQNDIDYIKNEINSLINNLKSNDKNKINALEYLNNKTNNNTYKNKEPFKKIIVNENEAIILNENKNIIGASDFIKINYSNDYGRHIIATKNIKPGESLLLNKPFASYLVDNGIYQFCSYCMKQTWSSVPCYKCVYTVYCSDKCRNLALSEYHDIECQLIAVSNKWGLGERPMLALKITILAIREAKSIENLEKKLNEIDNIIDPLEKGLTNGIFDSSKYTSVYSLSTDIDKKRSDQIFHYSNVSVILVYLLATRTNFLGKKIDKKPNDLFNIKNLSFIGKLLLKNCLIIKTNGFSIGDYEDELDFDERSIAIMPILSIFNHGCFCKTSRYEFNGKISLQSTCTIEKGEQIFINYGQTFESSPSCQRKQSIDMKFNFNCKCNACDDNWTSDLSSLPVMSIPHNIATKLIDVYKLYESELHTDEHDDSVVYFDDTVDRMNIKKQLVDVIEELYPHVRHPSRDLITFMDMLKNILGSRSTRWQTLN